jgi:large subunit ribosomal protein L3
MAARAIVGEKIGMTQVWDAERRVVPVTVLRVRPLRVVALRTPERDGYAALQVTYGVRPASRLTKPEAGHFAKAGVEPGEVLVEVPVDDVEGFEPGQAFGVEVLPEGTRVDVSATSKGHGFSGPVKRHNFRGQGAAHGNHKKHRAPGSVGACATPARVFRGTRMAGQYGGGRVTTLNLVVVQADPERELLLLRGAVPGPRGGLVLVRRAIKGGRAA